MRAGMDTAHEAAPGRPGARPDRPAHRARRRRHRAGARPTATSARATRSPCSSPARCCSGIARASRYTGVDNPRLWTTADVRAALEALGLQGRGPSVEELNGEGFPYSPYVLRRPELLTPAAMAAVPGRAGRPGGARPRRAVLRRPARAASREQPSPGGDRAGASPRPPRPRRRSAGRQPPAAASGPASSADTVAIDGPPEPRPGTTGGIGGLFADAEPVAGRRRSWCRRGPPVFPAHRPPRHRRSRRPPSRPRRRPPRPRFAVLDQESAGRRGRRRTRTSDERGSGRRIALLIGARAARRGRRSRVLVGWLVLGAATTATRAAAPPPGSTAAEATAAGAAGRRRPGRSAASSSRSRPCRSTRPASATPTATPPTSSRQRLHRPVPGAVLGRRSTGEPVVVSVARVRMPDTATARDLRALTDRNGSGNVNDLLREGVRYTGSPAELSGAEYASAVSGPTVTIVESAWVADDAEGELGRHRPDGRRTAWRCRCRPSPPSELRGPRSVAPRAPGSRRASGRGRQVVAAAQAMSASSAAIAGRPSRPALCGVELISPKTACARARQVAASAPGCSRASTVTHTST